MTKCTTNVIVIFLFPVIILQWLIINYLLIQRQNLTIEEIQQTSPPSSEVELSLSFSTKTGEHEDENYMENKVNNTKPIQSTLASPSSTSTSSYEGVATTLMINAPKWFQKRYSTMISNIYTNTPPSWAIQIFYIPDHKSLSQFGLNINPNLSRLNQTNDRIIFTPIPTELISKFGPKKKVLYWTNEWIWKNLVSDRVLVFNGNGVICSNSQLSLLDQSAQNILLDHVDYVGSPWRSMYGSGGDGAYSYRNRNAMIDAIQYKPYDTSKGDSREDLYFVKTLMGMNKNRDESSTYRIATKEQTHLFAGHLEIFTKDGDGPPPLPMVVSGTMANLDHHVRENVLASCPELSMMFPLLHNPSCFGAHPNGDECAKHICALNSENRKGGC